MTNKRTLVRLAATAAVGIIAFTLTAPAAQAQVSFGISIGQPPPPLRYEVPPPMPGPGFVWSEGYWEPFQGGIPASGTAHHTRALTTSTRTGTTTPTAGTCTKATGPTKTMTTTIGRTAAATIRKATKT